MLQHDFSKPNIHNQRTRRTGNTEKPHQHRKPHLLLPYRVTDTQPPPTIHNCLLCAEIKTLTAQKLQHTSKKLLKESLEAKGITEDEIDRLYNQNLKENKGYIAIEKAESEAFKVMKPMLEAHSLWPWIEQVKGLEGYATELNC